nr:uncharacterized protein LOC120967213 [Aegilops tauschii subsp. strangulata]
MAVGARFCLVRGSESLLFRTFQPESSCNSRTPCATGRCGAAALQSYSATNPNPRCFSKPAAAADSHPLSSQGSGRMWWLRLTSDRRCWPGVPVGCCRQVSSPGRVWDSLDQPDLVPLAVLPRIADTSAEPAHSNAGYWCGQRVGGASQGRPQGDGRRRREAVGRVDRQGESGGAWMDKKITSWECAAGQKTVSILDECPRAVNSQVCRGSDEKCSLS